MPPSVPLCLAILCIFAHTFGSFWQSQRSEVPSLSHASSLCLSLCLPLWPLSCCVSFAVIKCCQAPKTKYGPRSRTLHIERGNLIYDAVKLKIPPSITHTQRWRERGRQARGGEWLQCMLLRCFWWHAACAVCVSVCLCVHFPAWQLDGQMGGTSWQLQMPNLLAKLRRWAKFCMPTRAGVALMSYCTCAQYTERIDIKEVSALINFLILISFKLAYCSAVKLLKSFCRYFLASVSHILSF